MPSLTARSPAQSTTCAKLYAQIIARMPGLTLLNGSTVDALERRDSELHYLRGLLAQIEERPAQLQVPTSLPRPCAWVGASAAPPCV